ncbi:hypothetical protein L1987_13680 [Smallanthus sonchifolius]|uniref:Uncharacterized protein n=1 Tax=Smallanthus sonchifolius TaxID=185202 RepID=A0ACB9JJH9_9ASTR|nr:hypothetical protein L1987_13680 [Smallanthus sonchifolius]
MNAILSIVQPTCEFTATTTTIHFSATTNTINLTTAFQNNYCVKIGSNVAFQNHYLHLIPISSPSTSSGPADPPFTQANGPTCTDGLPNVPSLQQQAGPLASTPIGPAHSATPSTESMQHPSPNVVQSDEPQSPGQVHPSVVTPLPFTICRLDRNH